MTATAAAPASAAIRTEAPVVQHPLGRSVLLHLAPGAALTVFVVVTNALQPAGTGSVAADPDQP